MITAGGNDYSVDEALAIATGYAFARRPFVWKNRSNPVGGAPEAKTIPRWAYRTYDCILAEPGAELTGVDLFIADGLNGKMTSRNIAALIAVAPAVSAALREIPSSTKYWELPFNEIHSLPEEGSTGWYLWRAWALCVGATDVARALTHKTLHHKRQSVFPLIDNKTSEVLGENNWAQIHQELQMSAAEWTTLEERFAACADALDGVPLTRLRLHDILIWTRVIKQNGAEQAEARRAGEELLDGTDGTEPAAS